MKIFSKLGKNFSKAILLLIVIVSLAAPMSAYAVAGAGAGGADAPITLSSDEVTRMKADVQYALAHHDPNKPFTQADADEKNREITLGSQGQLPVNTIRALRDWDVAVQNQMIADQAAATASSSAATAANAAAAAANAASCGGLTDIGCWISRLPNLILGAIGYAILTFSGFILSVCGVLFNWTVLRTVFQFATYFGNSSGMLISWGVLRDVGNIVLLFGFIFLGIATILNVNVHHHSAYSSIPRLILFAILLNFSLFAAEAVIDASNAFSSVFAAQAGVPCTAAAGAHDNDGCANQGISGKALSLVGIAGAWQAPAKLDSNGDLGQVITTYLGGSIFLIILAVVLLAASIMLVIRAIVLCLLIITSPIGFAGMVLPPLESLANRWWKTLFNQSFFAPIFILAILVSFKVADGLSNGASVIAALQSGSSDSLQVILVFTVIIGFLIASLVIAKQMGAAGSNFAVNSASAMVFGGAARVTNLGIGGSAYTLRKIQQRTGFGGKAGEVAVNRFLRPLEKTNLDARRAPGMAALLGAGGITAGAKPAEHATFGDTQHKFSDIVEGTAGKKMHREYEDERSKSQLESNAHHGKLEADDEKYLQSLSTKQLEELHGIKSGVAAMAQGLSAEQFKNLMKSDKLEIEQKENLKKARYQGLNDALKKDPNAAKGIIKGMNKGELEDIPSDLLTNDIVLEALSDKQRDDLIDGGKRTKAEQDLIRGRSKMGKLTAQYNEQVNRGVDKATAAANQASAIASGLHELTAAQIAKLDSEVLTQDAVMDQLTGSVLKELQDQKKLNMGAMAKIGNHIRTSPTAKAKNYLSGPGGAYWS